MPGIFSHELLLCQKKKIPIVREKSFFPLSSDRVRSDHPFPVSLSLLFPLLGSKRPNCNFFSLPLNTSFFPLLLCRRRRFPAPPTHNFSNHRWHKSHLHPFVAILLLLKNHNRRTKTARVQKLRKEILFVDIPLFLLDLQVLFLC